MKRRVLFSFVAALVFSTLAYSVGDAVKNYEANIDQKVNEAALTGKVLDNDTGAVLPRVNLTLINGGRKTKTITDPEGNFKIGMLEPGAYTLLAADGEYKLHRENLNINKKQDVTIRMTPLSQGGL